MNNTYYDQNYASTELTNFLNSLEARYTIEQAQEKYKNLVNFSANAVVPYHQWFKYREGFAAELIKELIRMSNVGRNEVIIDPFCGSGTTNVVAKLAGYNTIGLDVNPMSAYITAAKTRNYSSTDLEDALAASELIDTFKHEAPKEKYKDIEKYFNAGNFHDLLRIKGYIDQIPDSGAKTILFVAFVSIIEECSDRKRDGNGLKTAVTKISNAIAHFKKKVELIVNDIRNAHTVAETVGVGAYSSAFDLVAEYNKHFRGQTAGAIIFSPPYANSFDYFESYKLELIFADFADGMKGIADLRKKAVRSFIGAEKQSHCDQYVDLIASEIETAIPLKEAETGKKDTRTRKVPDMLRGYFADMHEVIKQCSACLGTGKMAYIVVDQSAYLGKIVPTDLLLAYYAEIEGFEVTRIIECRKARTSTQQLNKYPYLKTALRESIVCLRKR